MSSWSTSWAAAATSPITWAVVPVTGSLEDAYMALTQESVEYHSTTTGLDPNHLGADPALAGTEGAIR